MRDSEECTLNIISEHFIEAANATSINAPYGISEWALTGLHPAPCSVVKASRVKEAIFSVEAKLVETREFESRATPGKKTGVLAIVEGVRFWAREDALNEDKNLLDPAVSKLPACSSRLDSTTDVTRFCARLPDLAVSRMVALPRPSSSQDQTLMKRSRQKTARGSSFLK